MDEEEPEPEPAKGKKSTAKPKASPTEERKSFRPSEPHGKPKAAATKPKRSGSGGGLKSGQGNLSDFFGKR